MLITGSGVALFRASHQNPEFNTKIEKGCLDMVALEIKTKNNYTMITRVAGNLRYLKRDSPRVHKALLGHSGLSEAQAKAALTLDMPSYKIVPRVWVPPSGYVPGYAHTDGYSDNILIRPEFAKEVQSLEYAHKPLEELGPDYPYHHVRRSELITAQRGGAASRAVEGVARACPLGS